MTHHPLRRSRSRWAGAHEQRLPSAAPALAGDGSQGLPSGSGGGLDRAAGGGQQQPLRVGGALLRVWLQLGGPAQSGACIGVWCGRPDPSDGAPCLAWHNPLTRMLT